jgi:hypothetical protein
MGSEIGTDDAGVVKVHRHEDEVFHPATIASFEGKTVTDLHPSQWVDTSNHSAYAKGHIQNVRRGTGEDSEYLLGDLHLKDASLINKVENGQREVSCGYNCDYEPIGEGKYAQKNIRGNHVAVVPDGRAGSNVKIRDHQPTKEKSKMAFNLKHIFGLGLKEFAKDAEPEEVAKAFEATQKGEERTKESNKDCSGKDAEQSNEHAGEMAQILEGLKSIEARIAALESSEAAEPSAEESLDAFVKELEGGEKEKEKEESKDEAGIVPVETLSGNEIPTNPITGADTAAIVKAMRPIIAAMTDPVAKKKACDALLASCKKPGTQNASYSAIAARQQTEDQKKAADAATADTDYGKTMKEKFHRKNTVR